MSGNVFMYIRACSVTNELSSITVGKQNPSEIYDAKPKPDYGNYHSKEVVVRKTPSVELKTVLETYMCYGRQMPLKLQATKCDRYCMWWVSANDELGGVACPSRRSSRATMGSHSLD
uniref:Ovule protein n=1 Tax=Angiostrongylus cantonensis TaxID=6313 RepID=A0A158PA28_ANGCA